MSHLTCYPVSSANTLYPFPLVTLCLLIFPAFLEVGSVEQGPWNVFPSRIRSWESAQWKCEAWLALSRTLGQLGGRCANSDSRCVKWGDLTSLQKVSDLLFPFWLCHGAVPWGVARLPPVGVAPYSCLLILWPTLALVLDFCLHHNITAVLSFDLQHCLKVGILPWAGFFLLWHNFFFRGMRDISHSSAVWLQHNMVLKVIPLRPSTGHGPL